MIEWLWESLFLVWRIFVILMIISAIGGAIIALRERFNKPDKGRDWRDDFR